MANEYTLGGPPPQSRSEKILMKQNSGPAQSRIEELLKNASGRTSGALVYKGTVETALSLPASGNEVGDVYHVNSDGSEWAWNGSAWEELGKSITNDAVLYTPMSLTPAQQEQARENIGAGTYTKPSGGIPASDLASGVIPIVPQMATQADMSDWTRGKTVDALRLKAYFEGALQSLDAISSDIGQIQSDLLEKADKTEIPTTTSDLTNDSGFQTAAQVQTAIAGKADKTTRIAMTAQDTTPTLDPNKLYVFPEMASLAITLATPTDATIVNEYHFMFTSGATAATLTIPATINQPDGFTVEANHVYEVSILEGCMTAQGWAVS